MAGLVARGLTDAEIAGELTLSVRTVEKHVSHIMSKLGVNTRGRIAAAIRPLAVRPGHKRCLGRCWLVVGQLAQREYRGALVGVEADRRSPALGPSAFVQPLLPVGPPAQQGAGVVRGDIERGADLRPGGPEAERLADVEGAVTLDGTADGLAQGERSYSVLMASPACSRRPRGC